MSDAQLQQLEEGFWQAAGDPARYAEHLAADAVHVFPGWGIADREAVLEGVAGAQPWQAAALHHVRIVPLGEDAAAVVYEARATRAEQAEYTAAITSVYRREGDEWKLVVHQQTPIGDTPPP